MTVCVGARRSSPNALCVGARRSLCQGPALSVSGFGDLCVGARRSLCRAPVSGPALLGRFLCRVPGLSLYVGARRCLCWGPRSSCQGLALSGSLCAVTPTPAALHPSPIRSRGPPTPIRVPPIRPAQIRATHPAQRVPFFQERTPNLSA